MAYEILSSKLRVLTFHDDVTDARTERYISWTKMDGACFLAVCKFLTGTGVLAFRIFAATSNAGANATLVLAHPGPTVADAANDTLVLEVNAEEVIQKLQAANVDTDGAEIYVSVRMDNDAAGDENSITYVIGDLYNPRQGATADVIA